MANIYTGPVIPLARGCARTYQFTGMLKSFAARWQNNAEAIAIVPFDRFVTGRIPSVADGYPFPYMALFVTGGSGHSRSDRSEWVRRTVTIHVWVDMAKLEEGEYICELLRQIYCNQSWKYDFGKIIDTIDHGPPQFLEVNMPAYSYKELIKTMTLCIQQDRVDNCVNVCQPGFASSSCEMEPSSSASSAF